MIGWVPSLSLLVIGVTLAGILAFNAWDLRGANSVVKDSLGSSQSFIPEARRELLLSAAYLADDSSENKTRLDAQRARTDQALATIQADAGSLADSAPPELDPVFAEFAARLGQMATVREQIDSKQASVLDATEFWGSMISQIADTVRALARVAPNGNASVEERSAADLIETIRSLAAGNGLAYVAFSNEGLTADEYQAFVKTGGTYRAELESIGESLPADEQARLKEITDSDAWRQQAKVEQAVLEADALTLKEKRALANGSATSSGTTNDSSAGADNSATDASSLPTGSLALSDEKPTRAQLNNGNLHAELPIASSAWETANDELTQSLTDFALLHLDYSSSLAVDAAQSEVNYAVYGGAAALLFGIAVFVITTRESNRLASRLRGLRDGSLDLANNRLPALVSGLRTGEVDEETRQMPKLNFGRDEIGEVADAFNHAQDVAVTAAVQEAETRAGLREVFLNIAYRSQVIVHRQLGVLEKAERYEEDPEQIELLFELDHLATRARRNAENLVILGGGQPGRRWRNSVDLLQVVRSSISEAQDYARVSIGRLPRLSINGGAVADVIHLLAELVDNATSFSPPMSKVEVRGNLVGKGLVLEIEDQGLGIPADKLTELNEMLKTAPDFHALTLREEPRLGMFVVAQLAAGQNIRVTLTPSPAYGGTKAVVLIPADLFDASGSSLTGAQPALALDGTEPADAAVGPGSRSLHERMAITGEMTGEITVIPSSDQPASPDRRNGAPALSVAPSEPRTATGPMDRLGRREPRGGASRTESRSDSRPDSRSDSRGSEPVPPTPLRGRPSGPGQPSAPQASRAGEPGPTVNPQARADYLASRGGGAPVPAVAPGTASLPMRTPGAPQNIAPGFAPAKGAPTPPAGLRGAGGGAGAGVTGLAGAPNGTAGPSAPAPRSGGGGRPELPRRTRQAHLSDRLKNQPVPGVPGAPESGEPTGPIDPEAARSRMAAFQRGTQRGRTERPNGGA
ncbi:nitrate- and nitrite sensing domain-containing protein [Kineosporia sp. J2-2]|uniref:histidine kinase n=1 Tax=Kineosporia corallincola TaxID=2835133 RepID=A0ABS5TCW5_9ACTN|nr:nitrate- and nitrite sensing domain-containing protein [Kineosporia corallincola]MBT0768930.1 nitrate- and nitrite sensing domain-containing protein [Kineosporia corallincola]